MSKVLITGGAGFIGYHLARELLEHGSEVDLLDNFSRAVVDPDLEDLLKDSRVRLLRQDLLDAGVVERSRTDYRHIYHLAAIIGVAQVLRRPYDVLSDNLTLLLNALRIARRQTALTRFIFVSTSEVYAGTLQHFSLPVPTPEDVPLALTSLAHPRTAYMLSKIYGEALCHHGRIPFTIVRPHNFYGPRMGLSHVVPELLKKAHDSEPGGVLHVASPTHRRAFCYISDAVRTIRLLAEEPRAASQTFNIGNEDQEIAIGELAQVVLDVVGKPLTVEALPDTPGSPTRRCPDIRHAVALTKFTPEVELAEGVAQTYQWYRDRVFAGNGVTAV